MVAPEAEPVASVLVPSADPAVRAMWDAVHTLAQQLPLENWVLIGGLMVQLHAFRHDAGPVRATEDIDVLGDSRARPSATESTADILLAAGFEAEEPYGTAEPLTVHRFVRDDVVVDVLGPDGMRRGAGPVATPPHETFPVPGGTQALKRAEIIEVLLPDKPPVLVPCPSLSGALLLKARSATTRAKDRTDLAVLLACVADPLGVRDALSSAERKWIRRSRAVMPTDVEGFQRLVGPVRGQRASQTLALLCFAD